MIQAAPSATRQSPNPLTQKCARARSCYDTFVEDSTRRSIAILFEAAASDGGCTGWQVALQIDLGRLLKHARISCSQDALCRHQGRDLRRASSPKGSRSVLKAINPFVSRFKALRFDILLQLCCDRPVLPHLGYTALILTITHRPFTF